MADRPAPHCGDNELADVATASGRLIESARIPAFVPVLPTVDALVPYLARIDHSRIYSNHGPLVMSLQDRLAALFGMHPYTVVAASSGTVALAGAILAMAGRAQLERPYAICPGYTFVATSSAIEQCGYQPYLADISPDTWMLDPEQIASHPLIDRVGVVVPVAAYGRAVDVEQWVSFMERTGIPVVIDAAAAIEAVADGRLRCAGSIPIVLSFHATKAFGCGEGGCVLVSDMETAMHVGKTLNFGFMGSRDSSTASFNGKMSEYHAAVAHAELDGWTNKRAGFGAVIDFYRRSLETLGVPGERFLSAPELSSSYAIHECVDEEHCDRLREALVLEGIESRLWYGHGLHRHHYLRDVGRDALGVTEAIASRLLGLPMSPCLSEAEVCRVTRVIARCEPAVRGQAGGSSLDNSVLGVIEN